ncbi:unnamed protein product [Cylicocyclus nassatus]|uniref:Uncharacterized protein n=1 Tax=Cylicocyclus nassatus TaxID=53992 RepID=A0AA36HE75_CYLNA|nr:unnamed protein product [Cylicocyclus nassatus]
MLESIKILLLICTLAAFTARLTDGSPYHDKKVTDKCWRECRDFPIFTGTCMYICTLLVRPQD